MGIFLKTSSSNIGTAGHTFKFLSSITSCGLAAAAAGALRAPSLAIPSEEMDGVGGQPKKGKFHTIKGNSIVHVATIQWGNWFHCWHSWSWVGRGRMYQKIRWTKNILFTGSASLGPSKLAKGKLAKGSISSALLTGRASPSKSITGARGPVGGQKQQRSYQRKKYTYC